ncbi:SWI/SNF complex subunit SWI3A-like [Lycium barbarum]|uniref:SWI/SNF complex subunit SWI3A-like n=1 Tax=Lycium barbarum TaxID=112863 RepID=UPI00293E2FA3|nr:SWI/SNF complex subunit SWI3A-like [Lycium barbarum]
MVMGLFMVSKKLEEERKKLFKMKRGGDEGAVVRGGRTGVRRCSIGTSLGLSGHEESVDNLNDDLVTAAIVVLKVTASEAVTLGMKWNCLIFRASQVESAEGEDKPARSETEVAVSQRITIPLNLCMRAATATAVGAAAAHAKLLADQEEREVEYLVSTLVEAQVKKLQRKMKHVDALNLMMEKQHGQMKDLEESLVMERMDILQKIFSAGVSRWRDHASVKS